MSDKPKQHKAMDIALYFIHRANSEKKSITNKKLQKLVYYAQVWSLVINKEKLFNEKIEAWVHGPAVATVYSKFKSFGFNPIDIETDDVSSRFSMPQKKVLDNIWRVYGKYDAEYLEALTHSEFPWQEARRELEMSEASNNEINLNTAETFYEAKLKRLKRSAC